MEGLKKAETSIGAGVEEASVGCQLEHLENEINRVDESFRTLLGRLVPLLPPAPDTTGSDCKKEETHQHSPMLEHVARLTGKLRSLNSGICQASQVIQI